MVLRAENTELRASLDAALAENGRMLQQSAPLPWSDADRTRALQELNGVANLGSHAATTGMHHGLCVEKHGDADTPKVRGSVAAMRECASKKHMMDSTAITREGNVSVRVNGKVISVDDISYGMEALFQQRHMHSQVTFFGVGMQQDPNDAIAIADLLWRVRPRLLIELGTSGGGSALFYARAMREYDPLARVLTMDPSSDTTPLKNWNHDEMAKFCSHCVAASSTRLWKDTVTFIRELPTSEAALAKATEYAAEATKAGLPVLIMEDSNHKYSSVVSNLAAYAHLVTPGSYLIVQDTRGGRYRGPTRAVAELLAQRPRKFVRDRRPEYFLFSQHTGGFLRRLKPGEQPSSIDGLD